MIPTWLMIGYLLASGADAVTTHIGLNRGAHELVLTQSPAANYAIIAGAAAGTVLLSRCLVKRRPRLAKGLLITAMSVRIAATTNNIRVIVVLQ